MDFIKDMMSGFIGGVCCTFAGLPLDLVKVRQQTIFKNKSLSGAFYHTIYNEGVLALWKGSLPALSSILTENAVVFAANGVIKRVVMDYQNNCVERLTFTQEALSLSTKSIIELLLLPSSKILLLYDGYTFTDANDVWRRFLES